jgi:hypothetical protein
MDNIVQDVEIKQPVVNYLWPERLKNESFEDYRTRRTKGNNIAKNAKHGSPKLIWESLQKIINKDKDGKETVSYRGNTYRKFSSSGEGFNHVNGVLQ